MKKSMFLPTVALAAMALVAVQPVKAETQKVETAKVEKIVTTNSREKTEKAKSDH